jgi:capsular polysaccharide biosynthesis protein
VEDDPLDLWRSEAESWSPLADPSCYTRRPPDLFNLVSSHDGLRRFILDEVNRATVEVPARDLYVFSDVIVSDSTYLFTSSGDYISLSLRDHLVHLDQGFDELKSSMSREIPLIAGRAAYVFKAGKGNYGHMMVEMLPKLEEVLTLGIPNLKVIIPALPGALAEKFMALIRRLYGEGIEFYQLRDPLTRFEKLYVPGPVSKHNNRKSAAVARFADRVRATLAGEGPERIYVSRSRHAKRPMTNESEIEDIFRQHGYEVVWPELHSLEEQVALFSQAKRIAGPLGAGLTNIMFAAPDAHVIMLDPGMYDFFFFDLAALRGQRFSWVFTEALDTWDISLLERAYTCDPNLVRGALKMLG